MKIVLALLVLGLFCLLLSELIQSWRMRKYIKVLLNSTVTINNIYSLSEQEKSLKEGIDALNRTLMGLGNEYLLPANKILDELSDDLSGQKASEDLKALRKELKELVKSGRATVSELSNQMARVKANALIIDAFNTRFEVIATRLKTDNAGLLVEELKRAFEIINMNASGLIGTSLSRHYLELRIQELKIGAALYQLKEIQKDEQRTLREAMREEEKENRERERAAKETQREEDLKAQALKQATDALSQASAAERAIYEEQVRQLQEDLFAIQEKKRALSMAQLTRVGTVYVISNIGSLGDGILKLGMTRRLEPMDRIYELSNASVPFEFDVHALISTDDAPKLESQLHSIFNEKRVNKINFKKEFFKVSVAEVKNALAELGINPKFTMIAEAVQYRETQAIEQLPEHQRKQIERQFERQSAQVRVAAE